MQTFQINESSIAASTTTANLLSGTPIQFLTKAAVLTVYANADAVGMTFSLSLVDGTSVSQVVPTGSGLSAASTAGKIKTNEDFIGQFAIPAGVQLILAVTNTTAGAIKVNFLFVVT
jgi:hypothetical protein